jgi:hypothetical protein
MRKFHGNARVVKRISSVLLTGLAFVAITGCSGRSIAPDAAPPAGGPREPYVDSGKHASLAYNYFFYDPVTASSAVHWNVANNAGKKAWSLSTTAYSAPRAWVIGQNYWNGENDSLTSQPFSISGFTEGVTFAFRLRYKLQTGDYLRVQYSTNSEGDNWVNLATYNGGQNQHYPNWTLRSFALPANDTNDTVWYRVRFVFTSNGSGTEWGAGVDSTYIYQQMLSAPRNLLAQDDGEDYIEMQWDHPADGPEPYAYWIYRATSPFDEGTLVGETNYPSNSWADGTAEADTQYYYYVEAIRYGYPDSPPSNVDGGARLSGN